jgi:hypothetical protein
MDMHVHVGVVQLLSAIIILGLGLRDVVFVLCGKKGTTDDTLPQVLVAAS